jgi:4-oxalocrotonate tautomerase
VGIAIHPCGLVPGIRVLFDGRILDGRHSGEKTHFALSPAMTETKRGDQMPEITVNMAAGRTDEQKAGMMRDITQALVKNLGVDAEAVVIQINEAPLAHKMKGGQTFVERFAKK